jgi:hypothetical protein
VVLLDALQKLYVHSPFRLAVGNVDKGPRTWHEIRSPTPALGAQGWVALALAPGRYYLSYHLRPGADPPLSEEFFFLVPRDDRPVYIGSLMWACIGPTTKVISRCGRAALIDESDAAKAAVGAWSPDLGAPVTSMMRPTGW